ncbi:hypothetical protein U9M48_032781, partial [Paspalum notatum var. saurae]
MRAPSAVIGACPKIGVEEFITLSPHAPRQATGAVPKREVNLYKDPAIRAKFTDQDGKADWIQYLDYIVFRKKIPKATDEEILGMMTRMRCHHRTTSKQEDVKVDEPAMKARFEEWIKKYGRIYKSEEEKARRYEIFKVNAIEADRANTSSPRSGPPFAPNNLGDWSKEELSGLYMHQGDFDWESYFDELGRMYDETGTYHYTAKSDRENCSEPVKQCYMKQAAMAAEKAAAAGGRTMGDDGATLNRRRPRRLSAWLRQICLAEAAMAYPAGYGGVSGYPMFGNLGSFTRFWLMEEEDDGMHYLADDDEEEAFLYAQMVQGENSQRRRRSDGPPKEIRPRHLADGDLRIRLDYFEPNCFRMRRDLVLRIVDVVEASNPRYFTRKSDCCGKEGLSALQKCVAALRILAYGSPADAVDEYVRIGASTAREALRKFCKAVIQEAPTEEDVARLLEENKQRGFPGMLDSIDCMHWEWRMCPTAWKGMFTGRGKHPSMIIEAIASHDLHIWHSYFGTPGSKNDINVLQRSPIFSNYLGVAQLLSSLRSMAIRTTWEHSSSNGGKIQHFSKRQKSVHKDIERAFGVLRARFAVVRGPACGWHPKQIKEIMMCCIILHNMVVEDE